MTGEREALISMVEQFAYNNAPTMNFDPQTGRIYTPEEMAMMWDAATFHTGGLSALEEAFDALGLPDPCTGADLRALEGRG